MANVSAEPCQIIFTDAVARVLSTSKTNFYLQFHATFFEEGTHRTLLNRQFQSARSSDLQTIARSVRYKGGRSKHQPSAAEGYTMPVWETKDLPGMKPIVPDRRYLEGEHLLVSLRSEDGDESYGESCISLMLVFGDQPIPFSCQLTHRGEHTGTLSGHMHIVNSVGASRQTTVSEELDEEQVVRRPELAATYPPRKSQTASTALEASPSVTDTATPAAALAAAAAAVSAATPLTSAHIARRPPQPLPPQATAASTRQRLPTLESRPAPPSSVAEWLASIGLSHLCEVFQREGVYMSELFVFLIFCCVLVTTVEFF